MGERPYFLLLLLILSKKDHLKKEVKERMICESASPLAFLNYGWNYYSQGHLQRALHWGSGFQPWAFHLWHYIVLFLEAAKEHSRSLLECWVQRHLYNEECSSSYLRNTYAALGIGTSTLHWLACSSLTASWGLFPRYLHLTDEVEA